MLIEALLDLILQMIEKLICKIIGVFSTRRRSENNKGKERSR